MEAGAVALHRFVLDPVETTCGGRPSCAGVVMTGRRLISIGVPPGGVNGHHPYRVVTRMITAGSFAPVTMWDRAGVVGWLEQAELAGPFDCPVAVLHAEFAVQGAMVGFHGVQRDIKPLADLTAR
jgi:hypothetical protein